MKWYEGTISVLKSAIFNNCALRAFVCVCVCVRTTRVFARMNYARYDVIIAKHAEISNMFRFNLIHLKNKPICTCIPRVSSSSVHREHVNWNDREIANAETNTTNICVTESQWFLPSNCSLCKLLITDSHSSACAYMHWVCFVWSIHTICYVCCSRIKSNCKIAQWETNKTSIEINRSIKCSSTFFSYFVSVWNGLHRPKFERFDIDFGWVEGRSNGHFVYYTMNGKKTTTEKKTSMHIHKIYVKKKSYVLNSQASHGPPRVVHTQNIP